MNLIYVQSHVKKYTYVYIYIRLKSEFNPKK